MKKKIKLLLLLFIVLFLSGCKKEIYKISYFCDDGQIVDYPTSYQEGDKFLLPIPIKDGYSFVGWYDNIEYKGEALSSLPVDLIGDVTFYAKYERNVFNINYVLDGGILEEPKNNYQKGEEYVLPEPLKEEYIFLGWYDNNKFTGNAITIIKTDSSEDLTLYAKYERYLYDIRYILDGGSIDHPKLKYQKGESYILPIPNKQYYRFLGWYDDQNFQGEVITHIDENQDGDLVYYAKFEAINYRIIYYSYANNKEEIFDRHPIIMGFEYNYPKENVFRYRSRTLIGWSFEKDGSLDITDIIYDTQVEEHANENGEVKLYALWRGPYEIDYELGKEYFIDKYGLRKAYFTDFYNFIISTDSGKQDMLNKGINTLDDFLYVASNINGGGGSQMTGIGNLAGPYYLKIEIGGKLEEQPTTHFIGYCYQNGMWLEFIDFLIEFFAYWRTDEGYTTPTNNGNDFFASAWASLVDTAKLFYYTKDTSYCQTERVVNCLENVPGCLNIDSLPKMVNMEDVIIPTISYDGFNFLGWYDNSLYEGLPLTIVSKDIQTEIVLYAKWEKIKEE